MKKYFLKALALILVFALAPGCAHLDTTFHPRIYGNCEDAGGFCGAPCPKGYSCQSSDPQVSIQADKARDEGPVLVKKCVCVAMDYKEPQGDTINLWDGLGVLASLGTFIYLIVHH
jgi:hypothetical protein